MAFRLTPADVAICCAALTAYEAEGATPPDQGAQALETRDKIARHAQRVQAHALRVAAQAQRTHPLLPFEAP